MARSRNIKHATFLNDELAELDPLARILFMGMWTIADFRGCILWREKKIKAQLLPYDNTSIKKLAISLDQSGFIRFYSVQGNIYLKVVNFSAHQNPHKNEREAGSDIPDYCDNSRAALDIPTLAIKSEIITINHDQNESDPADSLIPHPDSLNGESKESRPESGDSRLHCPHEKIINLYHEILPELDRVLINRWTGSQRAKYLQARWREDPKHQDLNFWKWFFTEVRSSDFYLGNNDRSWKANLEWLITAKNFIKLLEKFVSRQAT